jgi:hypothetical protein
MNPQIVYGFELRLEDIIISEPGVEVVAYSRIPQLRLVEKLRDSNPKAFDKLLSLTFGDDIEAVRNCVEENWGKEVAEILARRNVDVGEILPMINGPE